MKKLNWRHTILIALIGAIIYGLVIVLFDGGLSDKNINKVIFGSLFMFIFYAIGFTFFIKKLAPKLASKVKRPELMENESIVWEEPANLFRNKYIAVGGKVFLTEERLIFNSHKYNFQNGETSISRVNVAELIERKTMGLVDNGLRLITKDNMEFDFVLNNRVELIERLKRE
jgi:hypothetical protein